MSDRPRIVTLDIETQRGFHEVDRKKLHLLKVSVACIHDSATDSYHAYEERELSRLEEVLKQADLIVGFNIREFDMEVLAPYLATPVKSLPVFDLLEEIERVRGHRVSLQSVAQATLQSSKSGSGWDAIKLYREGRMEELKKYCFDDVRITKDVYEYGCKHGKISFVSNRDYGTHDVPVDWAGAAERTRRQKQSESSFPTSLF